MGNLTPPVATAQLEHILVVGAANSNPLSNETASGATRSRFRTFAIMAGLCVRIPLAQFAKASLLKMELDVSRYGSNSNSNN
jgi:hypothetical protein